MNIRELNSGYVLQRWEETKERARVCTPNREHTCQTCDTVIKGNCVRFEKGPIYLFWECFDCYEKYGKSES